VKLTEAPQFLSAEQVQAEVARFSYRPGWTLSTFVDPFEGVVFRVVADVPNGYRPDESVQLRINSRMPPMQTADQLAHWILWRICQIELHEAREWLRRDGEMLYDPHDPVEPS
jgi:hypothetical protein